MDGMITIEILKKVLKKTKGLKILKIKRDELFAAFNKSL